MTIYIAGVDEVGRGPLAGPVITAAVILNYPIEGITDSKKLSASKREKIAELIKQHACSFAYGRADVEEIDAINIHQATLLAMKRAIEGLTIRPDKVMVDGIFKPSVTMDCETFIKGDLHIYQIAAASILAKVARDAEMSEMDKHYPGYGFAKHKGYGTLIHMNALSELGACPIHRRSFAPVSRQLGLLA